MITVVSLSPALDVTYELAELVEGDTHRPSAVHRHPGGKGANLARTAATMGSQVRLITLLPASMRDWFTEQMAADGVIVHAVDTASPLRSCVSMASAATGLMTEVYEQAAVVTDLEAQALGELVRGLHQPAAEWLAFAGGIPQGAATALMGELLRGDGAGSVAVDTHGRALDVAVRHRPRLVKVNRAEAAALTGPGNYDAPLADLAAAMQQRTDGLAVVTDSVHGAVASDGLTTWRLGSPPATGAFPQGSGDAFLGGLLAALDRGEDWPASLRAGAGCATANALVPGAGQLDPQAARVLARDVELAAQPASNVPSPEA